jgi:similar to stage IV sporulation protein
VEGYSPERFFNLCNANGILIWGVEIHEQTYEMFVSVKDYRKLRPFVRKTRTKIILLEKHGLPFFLYHFRKRKVFFCGMAACILLVNVMSLFVWNIHIEGNITQKEEELLGYLETLGVEHGVFKSKITCENIETSLRSQYPNILWVSAEMRGTRIIIQIKENTDEDIAGLRLSSSDFI